MHKRPTQAYGPRYGVARVLSKRGLCSRSTAEQWVREGRVRVNGRCVRDPEFPVRMELDRVEVDAQDAARAERVCIALNKPRGLVTTTRDERGRDTVYACLRDADLPWLAPVGRLDKASEGLLLFSNDPAWAAAVLDPERGPDKTYHVQVAGQVDEAALQRMREGVDAAGEHLAFKQVRLLRMGERSAWLEVLLDEGRNRQIRRVLEVLGYEVRRLLRVAIGPLQLGELPKGGWRRLSGEECERLLGG